MIPVLLYAIYILLVWTNIDANEATLQLQERLLWISAPLMVFPVWWPIRLLRTIPDREIAMKGSIAKLERRLTPLLTAQPLNGGRPARWLTGAVNRGIITRPHPDFSEEDFYLGLECSNKTDHLLQNCTATLLALETEGLSEDIFTDPIQLEWLLIGDTPDHHAQFPPGQRRKLMITKVVSGVPQLYGSRLPKSYQTLFDNGRNAVGRILLEPAYEGATLVDFRIVQDSGEANIQVLSEPMPVDTGKWPKVENVSG